MKALTLKPAEPLTIKVPFRVDDKPTPIEGWRPDARIAPEGVSLAAPVITRAPGAGIKAEGKTGWLVTVPVARVACLKPGAAYVVEVSATHPTHGRVVVFEGKFHAPQPLEENPDPNPRPPEPGK